MENSNFLIVNSNVLPKVFIKVLEAKTLLTNNEVSGVTEATETVGISRSTYYKYCNDVFKLTENNVGTTATISLNLKHTSGILSSILDIVADNDGNILTITQESPVDGNAKVTLKLSMSNLKVPFSNLIDILTNINGVNNLSILIIE